MRSIILATSLFTGLLVPGDDKSTRTYLNTVMEPTNKGRAAFYKEPAGQDGALYVGKIFNMNGALKAEGHYADPELKIPQGHFKYYYADGKIESEGDYTQGNKSGIWLRFDDQGLSLAEKVYNPAPLENIIYSQAPTMPQYPGGTQAMITYLKSSVGSSPGATASFVVEKDGDLSAIKVIGAQPAISEQLVQALDRAPRFEVGEKDGLPVRVQMRVALK